MTLSLARETPTVLLAGDGRRCCRIAFIGSKCLLDDAAGIAHSIRTILEQLAKTGAEASSLTASLFDADHQCDLSSRIDTATDRVQPARNGLVRVTRHRVQHWVVPTANSQARAMTRRKSDRLFAACQAFLRAKRPSVVISYGTGSHARRLHDAIRSSGAQLVFYLGNAEIPPGAWFQPGDRAVSPSRFLADHYSAILGTHVDVLYPIVSQDRFGQNPVGAPGGSHQARFITHINPVPRKGLTMLIALAQRALTRRPDMRFLVLEGVTTAQALRQASVDLTALPNVTVAPVQKDMRSVYARTSVLLMPSFWREGFGRAAVEAHLSGVPVLASDHGGLPEALAGGGCLLPVPQTCVDEPLTFPDAETVDLWWAALVSWWDHASAYRAASELALQAGRRFHPDKTASTACKYFQALDVACPAIPA